MGIKASLEWIGADPSRAQPDQELAEPLRGPSHGLAVAFLVDARSHQLEIECAAVAGFQDPSDDAGERYRAVARNGAARERPVAEHVVGDLDQVATLHRAFDRLPELRLGPGGKDVDHHAETRLLRQL